MVGKRGDYLLKKKKLTFDIIYILYMQIIMFAFVFQQNVILVQVYTPKNAVEINQFTIKS